MKYKISGVPVKNQRKKPRGNLRKDNETRKHRYIIYELIHKIYAFNMYMIYVHNIYIQNVSPFFLNLSTEELCLREQNREKEDKNNSYYS